MNNSTPSRQEKLLLERVAKKIMGWPTRKGIMKKPERKTYCFHVKGFYGKGKDAFMINRFLEDEGIYYNAGEWNPLADWNHTMEMVERMRELEFRFCLGVDFARFWKIGIQWADVETEVCEHDPKRAICLAALIAINHD